MNDESYAHDKIIKTVELDNDYDKEQIEINQAELINLNEYKNNIALDVNGNPLEYNKWYYMRSWTSSRRGGLYIDRWWVWVNETYPEYGLPVRFVRSNNINAT